MKKTLRPRLARADAEARFGGQIVERLSPAHAPPLVLDGAFTRIEEVMQRNRLLLEQDSDWVGAWVRLRRIFFDDGLRFSGAGAKWLRDPKQAAARAMIEKLNADLWHEWLLQDNAAVFWMEPPDGKLPRPIVLDGESCEYANGLGGETLTLKLPTRTLSDAEKRGLTPRWLEAYKKGRITLDPERGEHFAVLTRAKEGKGFGMPRLRGAYRLLSNLAGIQIGDASGAYWHRDVIQSILAGHEIKTGDLAGQPHHFIKPEIKAAIEKAMKTMRGTSRSVRNFDVAIGWDYLDPKFFDATKYEGTLRQLDRWGGAALLLLTTAQESPFLLVAFAAEGRHDRDAVGGFLARLLARPEFLPKTPAPLVPRWNPHTFRDGKTLLEAVRMSLGEGLASRETGREVMGLDHEQEGDRLEAEAKRPARNRPGFEPKQGMLTDEGGRPREKPGDR